MKKRILLFVLLVGLLAFSACENDLEAVKKVLPQEAMMKEVIRDFQTFYSDSAVVRVKVSGPVMIRHLDRKNPHQEFTEGLNIDFFDAQKRVRGELTARYGIRYENKKEFVMQDSVVWKSKRGETLETEELIWDDRQQKVYSNKFVEITKPGEKVYGYGFETDKDFSRWKIKQVEGILKVEGISKELEGGSERKNSVTKPAVKKKSTPQESLPKPNVPAGPATKKQAKNN